VTDTQRGRRKTMKVKQVSAGPTVTWVAVLQDGDELLTELTPWIEQEAVAAASITGIGGFQQATLAYFDTETHSYHDIPVPDRYQLHAHAVCGRRDGTTVGGHIRRAVVRPTLELVITQTPEFLRRRHDLRSGLALVDLDANA
jgi:hypothetical protein